MKKLLLVSLLFSGGCALAQSVPISSSTAFDQFLYKVTGAGQTTVSFGGGGTALASSGNGTLYTDGGGAVNYTRPASIPNPSGNPVPVVASGALKMAGAAGVGALLWAGAKVLWNPVVIGFTLYQFAKELGWTGSSNGTGGTGFTKDGQHIPGAVTYTVYGNRTATSSTLSGAFAAAYAGLGEYPKYAGLAHACPSQGGYVDGGIIMDMGGWTGYTSFSCTVGQAIVGPPVAVGQQEFIDGIATQSGWPATSNLAQATDDAQVATGTKLAPAAIVLSGPATSVGTTTETTNADGTKTLTTTKYDHTYSGPTMTSTATTTITNYDSHNVAISTSTTTAPADKPAPTEPAQTDCDKQPNSIGCSAWGDGGTPPAIPQTNIAVTYTPLSFAGAGSCPADVTFAMLGKSYAISWSPMCGLMQTLAPIFLALGAAAAALIFMDGLKS